MPARRRPHDWMPDSSSLRRGVWQGLAAYTIWGTFPIYWKLFHGIPALEVLAHRVTWSFVAVTAMLVATGRLKALVAASRSPRQAAIYGLAAVLIGINWFLSNNMKFAIDGVHSYVQNVGSVNLLELWFQVTF